MEVDQVSAEFPKLPWYGQMQAAADTRDLSTGAVALHRDSSGKITPAKADMQHTVLCKLSFVIYSPDCSLEGKKSSRTP